MSLDALRFPPTEISRSRAENLRDPRHVSTRVVAFSDGGPRKITQRGSQRNVIDKLLQACQPFRLGTREETGHAALHAGPKSHVLERLAATLPPSPLLIWLPHQPYIDLEQIFHFPGAVPLAPFHLDTGSPRLGAVADDHQAIALAVGKLFEHQTKKNLRYRSVDAVPVQPTTGTADARCSFRRGYSPVET